MIRILFTLIITLHAPALFAQKMEQRLDNNFKPVEKNGRYYAVTEQKDSLWYREAIYLPEQSIALAGWYKDKECTIPHGEVVWFHPNKTIKSEGIYVNGKKENIWKEYDEGGKLTDSAFYVADKPKGLRLCWTDGILTGSLQYDGAGNCSESQLYKNGKLYCKGQWVSDTLKQGLWQYYHKNGQLWVKENFENGESADCHCYDSLGKQFPDNECIEKEAEFPAGSNAWTDFISKNMKPDVPINRGARRGVYTVLVQFVVDKEGRLTDIKPLTNYGYGMEEETIRVLKKSPRWKPALMYGIHVNAYRKQPITFYVDSE